MKILMLTNTFSPHVGGVAGSVQRFTDELRRRGHRVLVVAPQFEGVPEQEADVVRIPAVQRYRGSDFSVPMPVPSRLAARVRAFGPQVVHSHHPFLLGDTALRIAAGYDLPMVFTHHTLYERYTHYVPGDSPSMRRFAIELTSGYCNLCDTVVAPSESVARLLRQRGVKAPLEVIPTGVDRAVFESGEAAAARRAHGIPAEAFVVGHVGRLAPEKNLPFLAEAVARFLERRPDSLFLVAGVGPCRSEIRRILAARGLEERLLMVGVLDKAQLADLYRAMDVFAFASQSETQGMVLAEAAAAGVPLVAVDASGVREVVRDGENGRLLPPQDAEAFALALGWVADLSPEERRGVKSALERTSEEFSLERSASRLLSLYDSLLGGKPQRKALDDSAWKVAQRRLAEEWRIWRNIAHAAGDAVLSLPTGGEEESGAPESDDER